jgi:hypothetical protein
MLCALLVLHLMLSRVPCPHFISLELLGNCCRIKLLESNKNTIVRLFLSWINCKKLTELNTWRVPNYGLSLSDSLVKWQGHGCAKNSGFSSNFLWTKNHLLPLKQEVENEVTSSFLYGIVRRVYLSPKKEEG